MDNRTEMCHVWDHLDHGATMNVIIGNSADIHHDTFVKSQPVIKLDERSSLATSDIITRDSRDRILVSVTLGFRGWRSGLYRHTHRRFSHP